MITFVAEVKYPQGTGFVSAVSFQPIFKTDGILDLELTFLATTLKAEGNGIAIWLVCQSMIVLSSMKWNNVYVQSCLHERTLAVYHRLSFTDISYDDVSGLFFLWKNCQLMITSFDKLLLNLTSDDVMFVSSIEGIPQSHITQKNKVKLEKNDWYNELLETSDEEESGEMLETSENEKVLETSEKETSGKVLKRKNSTVKEELMIKKKKLEDSYRTQITYIDAAVVKIDELKVKEQKFKELFELETKAFQEFSRLQELTKQAKTDMNQAQFELDSVLISS